LKNSKFYGIPTGHNAAIGSASFYANRIFLPHKIGAGGEAQEEKTGKTDNLEYIPKNKVWIY
jgi:hypothetical protein